MSGGQDGAVAGPEKLYVDRIGEIIESDSDLVGRIALATMIVSSVKEEKLFHLLRESSPISVSQINVFRSHALALLDEYQGKALHSRMEIARSEITNSSYHDLIKSYFDSLVREQNSAQRTLLAEIRASGSAWRQIIISVAASFVFGLVIFAATLVDNPFGPIVNNPKIPKVERGDKGGETAAPVR